MHEVTIQRTIESAIERIVKERVHLSGSGRTDAGVHASGQVANFRSGHLIEALILKRALNGTLPPDIAIKRVEEVPLEFDSCLDATSKTYRYSILNCLERCAIGRQYCLHVPISLDVESMQVASAHLVGEHDFSSFRSSSCSARNPVRRVQMAQFRQEGDLIHFWIESDGFLHHMVRAIVGTLLQVGRGKLLPEDFGAILEAKDRRRAGRTAQPHGLSLLEVKYHQRGVNSLEARQEKGG
jgi:tRNA pseudouridine38-40 synthase